ncbi:MAG: hypothetical protein ABJD07_10675 [Gemmatimonadaceae bacterium]
MRIRSTRAIALAAAMLIAGARATRAQQPAAAPPPAGPAVGEMAPDFTLRGATRYGLLRDPLHLEDFRGRTVVLAFFPRARTKG